MIKKIYLPLLVFAFVGVLSLNLVTVSAQTQSVDDSTIEQRLEEQGVEERPEEIELEPITTTPIPQTSGFVDEDGNPISIEEYEEMREREEEGLVKQPWFYAVLAAIVAIVVALAVVKRKK